MTTEDRERGIAMIGEMMDVSRETMDRLDNYVALLEKWQRAKNLVGSDTLARAWTRHVADSAQALAAVPDAKRWLDLGSGAGFPGVVTAILLAGVPGAGVDLIESNARKCAFLRAAIRETGAPARVHCGRIDDVLAGWRDPVQAISARALAPLPDLVAMTAALIENGAVGVFHKGQDVEGELTATSRYWKLSVDLVASRTDPCARLVIVRDAVRIRPMRQGAEDQEAKS